MQARVQLLSLPQLQIAVSIRFALLPTVAPNRVVLQQVAAIVQTAYCGMKVLPEGPMPVIWMITSPSFAQV